MKRFISVLALGLACAALSFAGGGAARREKTEEFSFEGEGLSLEEAINQSAGDVAVMLPQGTRVAIAAFSSEHENLSNYCMDELGGALVEGGIEVADRRNLGWVYKELNFQMSGMVSDKEAVSVGKFLGAKYVLTGQFLKAGDSYRYRVSGINVETAIQESSTRLNVRDGRSLRSLLADVKNGVLVTTAAAYGEQAKPRSAGTFLDRGILFASRGEYELAIADFTEAIRLDPNYIAAYNNRGIVCKNKGDYDRAIADYTQAIRLEPNNATAYYNRGNTYADKKDNDRAIADYTQAIMLEPDYADTYINRGIVYRAKNDYDRAIADYNQAIRLAPNNAAAYNNRGNTYAAKKDNDRAIADFTQAIRLDPDYAFAYINRGAAYYDKGEHDRAIADFTQTIRLDPNFAGAYFNRGIVYAAKKDYDQSIADFEAVLRIDPNHTNARNYLEAVRRARGR